MAEPFSDREVFGNTPRPARRNGVYEDVLVRGRLHPRQPQVRPG
ncbi:MAG: hypothetical protein ACK4R2_08170 [Roseateles sp.]